jgi:hypothetical protein
MAFLCLWVKFVNSGMKVTAVEYVSDYSISVSFEDGVKGVVDLSELVEKGIFKVLQDKKEFAKVYSNGYAVAWSDELEIDATSIYLDITGKHFGEIAHPIFSYAAD